MTNTGTHQNIHDLLAAGKVVAPKARLTKEEKEALADKGTQFVVTDIRFGTDKDNREYWSVNATIDDNDVQFNIGSHPRRDTFMQSLSIAVGDGPIDGLRLVAYPGQGGNAFVCLEPAF